MSATASRHVEESAVSEDTLSLSVLDVLSCGLGAAIYLFLVFAAMPHLGSERSAERAAAREEAPASVDAASSGLDENAGPGVAAVAVSVDLRGLSVAAFPAKPWQGLGRRATGVFPYEVDGSVRGFARASRGRDLGRVSLHVDVDRLDPAVEIEGEVTLWIGGRSLCLSIAPTLNALRDQSGVLFTVDLSSPRDVWLQGVGGRDCGG